MVMLFGGLALIIGLMALFLSRRHGKVRDIGADGDMDTQSMKRPERALDFYRPRPGTGHPDSTRRDLGDHRG